ncbi:MAG: glycosyltransferase family 4 protein [Planctomycetota bacterium]
MKIAIVIERLEAWRGGAETSTLELARLLAARGHEIHIVTTTNMQSPPDLTIHRVPGISVLPALRTVAFVRNTMAFLATHKFDLVHSIAPVPSADVYQPRGGLLGETMERNVATRQSASRRLLKRALMAMNVKQRAMLDLERQVFARGGPTILAVSEYVARQCERLYAATAPRVRVVFNGVRTTLPTNDERNQWRAEVRKQYHLKDDTLLLLFIAHNFRLKGLDSLIGTMSRLVLGGVRDVHLLVVGRDNPTRFVRRIHSLGIGEFFTFAGPTQRVATFFQGADACVHPTYYDPCSRVVLEALSYGLPAITTSFNGASEVMTDGCEGFVIDTPENLGLWARRIDELRSPELRRKMREKALLLRGRLSMERHVDELETVFREIADRKKSQPTAGAGR